MESLDLQNEVVLKFYAGHKDIQNPVDREKFPSLKIKILFWLNLTVLIIVFNQEHYMGQSKHTSQLSDALFRTVSRKIILHYKNWKTCQWNAVPKITLPAHLSNSNFTYKGMSHYMVFL